MRVCARLTRFGIQFAHAFIQGIVEGTPEALVLFHEYWGFAFSGPRKFTHLIAQAFDRIGKAWADDKGFSSVCGVKCP
jgi:hypothetical protein